MVNARTMADKDAAVIVENNRLEEVNLIEEAVHLITTGRAERMSVTIKTLKVSRVQPAAELIAREIVELIDLKKEQ
jgi:hypothetical protein